MTSPVRPTSPIPMPPGRDVSWNRSSFCNSGGCVEVVRDGDRILVRDSKRDDSPVLSYSLDEWGTFVVDVRGGVLPYSAFEQVLGSGVDLVRLVGEDLVRLEFDKDEWSAFVKGAKAGGFDLITLSSAPDRGVDTGADEAAVVTGQLPAACETGEGVDPPAPSPVSPRVGSMNGGGTVMDSPAGRGLSALSPAADVPVRADQPGLDPTAVALIRLIFEARERDPWDDVDEWAFGRAVEVYRAAFAAGFALARAGDGVPAWRSGPLVQHVPATLNDFETSPASVSVEAVGSSTRSAPTASGGEVAPTADGATEPAKGEFCERHFSWLCQAGQGKCQETAGVA